MIARTWRGATRSADADRYVAYMQGTGIREYRETDGNLAVLVLRRTFDDGEKTEFVFISLWESVEAIRRFAGDSYEQAVFYPNDDRFLVDRDPGVNHYEVVGTDLVGSWDSLTQARSGI